MNDRHPQPEIAMQPLASQKERLIDVALEDIDGPQVYAEGEEITEKLFQPQFISYIRREFDKFTPVSMQASVAQPLLNYMSDLYVTNSNFSIKGKAQPANSYDGLFALFDEKLELLLASQTSNKAISATLNETRRNMTKLITDIKRHIHSTQKQFHEVREDEKQAAIAAVKAAQRAQNQDLCLMLACVCWCPVENVLTVLNCFGIDESETCCRSECASNTIGSQVGRWHLFAPIGSIRNLGNDYKEQSKVIEKNAPIAQRMV